MSKTATKRLVYGNDGDSLVFIEYSLAMDLAAFWDAIGSVSTWGEFRRRVSPERYEDVVDFVARRDEEADAPPSDSDPFPDPDLIVGGDGDYPEWPAQRMADWMPRSLLESGLVERAFSGVSGPCLHIEPEDEAKVVAALRAEGFVVEKDKHLVSRASGME